MKPCEENADWGDEQLGRLTKPRLAGVVARNVKSISRHRERTEFARTREQRFADLVTRAAGNMTFVYLHIAWFVAWIAANLLTGFDAGFADLTMILSMEAIFLTVFVLISQNRQGEIADRRAELDLQINLLAEHETTRILTLVLAIAQKAGVDGCSDPELDELRTDVAPEEVLDQIEKSNGKGPQ
jgi:uncharacterized membrane protein